MRSYTNRTTTPTPTPTDAPPARRRRSSRGTPSTRRRAQLAADAALDGIDPSLRTGPVALYRAEKARRATSVTSDAMADAKRMYDEAMAETAMKRAGMRTAVVAPKRRAG